MRPANARDEEAREEGGDVDEGRAEVGLPEDEQDRNQASPTACSATAGRFNRRTRSTRKPARARTKRSLPNSEGWNWNGPRSIQRREPRVSSASG